MSRRFFLPTFDATEGALVTLSADEHADEIRHIRKSLRLRPGDLVTFVNGRGLEAEGEILASDRDRMSFTIKSSRVQNPPTPKIVLAQALLKGQRMDWLVEKATEMGAGGISPMISDHSVASEEDAIKRNARWERIAQSALKQSGGIFLPDLNSPVALGELVEALKRAQTPVIYLDIQPALTPLWAQLSQALLPPTKPSKELVLFVGPEGGFHAEEVLKFQDAGFLAAGLGESILRAETAAIAALAIAKHWLIADKHR
jgi:16S rRNA (uracil1498-N3)-methyltransferase